MKKLLLLLPVVAALSFGGAKTGPTEKEKKFAIDYLTETKNFVAGTIDGLSENQLNFKPAADRWSVKECLQHIAITEDALWGMCDGILKAPATPEKRSEVKLTDEQVIKIITDRSTKVKTYEQMEPGKSPHATVQDALKAFNASRDKLIGYMKNTSDDMRNHLWNSPFGMVDSYQVVLFIAGHTNRHTQQMIEVKADPGFPKE